MPEIYTDIDDKIAKLVSIMGEEASNPDSLIAAQARFAPAYGECVRYMMLEANRGTDADGCMEAIATCFASFLYLSFLKDDRPEIDGGRHLPLEAQEEMIVELLQHMGQVMFDHLHGTAAILDRGGLSFATGERFGPDKKDA